MPGRAYYRLHGLARAAASPVRRALRDARGWSRDRAAASRPPRWWPDRLGWPGPRGPHDGKSVVIFDGGSRFEFAPAGLGPYRGHVYAGSMRPDAADVAERLARVGLPTDAARTLAIVSGFEGGFDSIQTYDRGRFAWGFIQFTATGGLPRLLHAIKERHPALFAQLFAGAGIDATPQRLIVRAGGRLLAGRAAVDRLHDDPSLWTPFLRASRMAEIQDVQAGAAYENYYVQPLGIRVRLGGRDVTLGALFADDECGRAVVCDRTVKRGPGYVAALFRKAVRRSGAHAAEDAPAILTALRRIEAYDARRLDALERQLRRP